MNLRHLALLVASGAALGGCHTSSKADPADTQTAARVQVAAAIRQVEPEQVRCQATLIADPRHLSKVSTTQAEPILAVHVRVGDAVSKGELLIDMAEDPHLRSDLAQAEIQLAAARRALDREQALVRGGVEPRVALEQARTQCDLAASQENTAQKALALAQAGTHLRAPTGGVVTAVSAAVGQVSSPGVDLVEVADPGKLFAALQVEPGDLPRIRAGQSVELRVPDSSRTYSARLLRVSATLNPQTQLGEADAELVGAHPELAIGRFLDARVTIGERSALLVPKSALVHRDDGDKVYLMASGKAKEVAIQRGPIFGDLVAISGEVRAGDNVVLTGAYELSDGDPVVLATAASGSAR